VLSLSRVRFLALDRVAVSSRVRFTVLSRSAVLVVSRLQCCAVAVECSGCSGSSSGAAAVAGCSRSVNAVTVAV
jgi:hypothetical protein